MFVKLLDKQNLVLILNVKEISSLSIIPIRAKVEDGFKVVELYEADYSVSMTNGKQYIIEKDQYEQLCTILTKQV